MIAGMLPMTSGLSEGGEQVAPSAALFEVEFSLRRLLGSSFFL
jgi:hypothetical protein